MPHSTQPSTDVAERVRTALEPVLDRSLERLAEVDPRVASLGSRLRDFVLDGGKRIRSRFALAGWTATPRPDSGPVPDEVVAACAALELVQGCALIHDDIIDDSDTRRGSPTVHRAVAAELRASGRPENAENYGVAQAILLGDLALSWADDAFLDSGVDPVALRRALGPWSAMKTEVLGGQQLDVLAEAHDDDDEDTPRRINRYKTAAYTVERPLHIGASLAGAGPETIAALRGFGVRIGSAFQLRDDMLGVFGDPEVTGKPSGDDLREGKRTLLVARALATAAPADAALIRDRLGSEMDADELQQVRAALHRSGAVEEVEAEIAADTRAALECIDGPEITAAGRTELVGLAEAATRRRS